MRLSRLFNLTTAFAEILLSRPFAPKAKAPLAAQERAHVRRILVFGYLGLGDGVMILPALKALRQLFPNATLDFIGSRRTAAYHVVQLADIFRTMHFFEFKTANWRERRQMNKFLIAQGYDCVFCSYTAPIEHFVPFLKTVPHRAGHTLTRKSASRLRFRPDWLLHYAAALAPDEQIHETERYARIIRVLAADATISTTTEAFHFFTPQLSRSPHQKPHVAVHAAVSPLLGWKNWGTERFIALCQRLVSEYAATITLLGDASERTLLESMAEKIGHTAIHVSTPRAGDFSTESLAETCRVLASADVFVGNESGVGHIAMALGVPSVRIFGMTDYASFRALDAERHTDIRKDLPCSPCFVLGQVKRESLNVEICGHKNCLNTITVDEIFHAVAQKIALNAA
ncbi:MAG: glycosyltransferase family 9 protein [Candidatus Kapaibacteriota bacterium]|jgi:ADP-heptose:LPS heptosyltransferase